MPCLTLRRPRGVYLPPLQHPHGPKTTRGFNRARACTRPTQPDYAALLPETEPATNCARDADAGWPALLATLSFLFTTNLSNSIFGDVLGPLQTVAHTAGCLALPTHAARSSAKAALPHASSPRSMNRNKLQMRCTPRSHLRDSRSVWWEVPEVPPHHSHQDLAHAIWHA